MPDIREDILKRVSRDNGALMKRKFFVCLLSKQSLQGTRLEVLLEQDKEKCETIVLRVEDEGWPKR